MMEDIVHGHGDLFADLLEEFQVRFTIGFFLQTQKSHRAQPPHRGRQGNNAKRVHAVLAHAFSDFRPAMFFGKIRHEDGLLRLPDQSGGSLFDRLLMAAHEIGRHIRLNGVQSHRVSYRIVKDRATKFTWTTRGRRWARSRKSSWRSRWAEIASATSSRAWYCSARVSQGDAECLSIDAQYGLLIVAAQELPAAPVADAV